MAKIITIANQKGGSGKTTLTMQLAGTLARRKKRVFVADADPQGTATRWAASAADAKPFPATVAGLSAAGGKVHRELQKFVNDYDLILVDCPPSMDSPVSQSALLVSDLALIPVIPSPADLWATQGILKLIESVSGVNEGLQVRLVVNMAQPQTNLAREALEVLGDFDVKLASTALRQRTAYRESSAYGGTVHDLGSKANDAIAEVEALADEVLRLIRR